MASKLTCRQRSLITIRTLGAMTGFVLMAFSAVVLIQYYVERRATAGGSMEPSEYIPLVLTNIRPLTYGGIVLLVEARSSALFRIVPALQGPRSRAMLYLWIAADLRSVTLSPSSDYLQYQLALVVLTLAMVLLSVGAALLYVKDPDKTTAATNAEKGASARSSPAADAKKTFALQAAV